MKSCPCFATSVVVLDMQWKIVQLSRLSRTSPDLMRIPINYPRTLYSDSTSIQRAKECELLPSHAVEVDDRLPWQRPSHSPRTQIRQQSPQSEPHSDPRPELGHVFAIGRENPTPQHRQLPLEMARRRLSACVITRRYQCHLAWPQTA